MKSVKIIELLEGNTYKVWHDFKKEAISEKELEEVMDKLAGRNVRVKIKDHEVFCCLFEDDKLIQVQDMIWIWVNCPEDYLKDIYEDFLNEEGNEEPLWDIIESQCEFAYKGYSIDSPFGGGDGVFHYLGFE